VEQDRVAEETAFNRRGRRQRAGRQRSIAYAEVTHTRARARSALVQHIDAEDRSGEFVRVGVGTEHIETAAGSGHDLTVGCRRAGHRGSRAIAPRDRRGEVRRNSAGIRVGEVEQDRVAKAAASTATGGVRTPAVSGASATAKLLRLALMLALWSFTCT